MVLGIFNDSLVSDRVHPGQQSYKIPVKNATGAIAAAKEAIKRLDISGSGLQK
jgi:hypothetical protein